MTPRTGNWPAVKETRRRERRIHDVLSHSVSARLHQRVAQPDDSTRNWTAAERPIVETERALRALDPSDPRFWIECRKLEDELGKLYHDAGLEFRT